MSNCKSIAKTNKIILYILCKKAKTVTGEVIQKIINLSEITQKQLNSVIISLLQGDFYTL